MSCKLIARINPFDTSKRIAKEIEPAPLRNIYDSLNLTLPITHARFTINDRLAVDLDECPADGDTIFLAVVPGSGDNKEMGAGEKIIGGLVAAVGVAMFFVPGMQWAGAALLGAGISMFAGGVVLYNMDLSMERDQVKSAPNIRGSRNKTNYNGAVPLVLGTHRLAPHNGGLPYTEIVGNDQYLHQLFVLGSSGVVVDPASWKIGDTPLSSFDGVTIAIDVDGGTLPDYPNIVREISLGRLLAKQNQDASPGDILVTTPTNTEKLVIDFAFNGLVRYNKDNDKVNRTVQIAVDYKKAGDPDSSYQTIETRSVTAATTKTQRVVISKTLDNATPSGADYTPLRQYDIRLRRITADSTETTIIDKCYAGSVRSIQFSRPISAVVQSDLCVASLKIKATDQLSGVVDQLSCVVSSVVPDYSGTGSGIGAWTPRVSSNPASLYLYVLTDPKINPRPRSFDSINWPELEAWHAFCADKGYQCDMIIDQDIDRDTLLAQIAQCGRATPVKVNGKYYCVVDAVRPAPMQIFSPRNSWDYSGSKAFPDYPHALKLNFINRDLDYQEDQVIVYDDGYNKDGSGGKLVATMFQEVDTRGVVNASHIWKEGRYKIAAAHLRPETHELVSPAEYLTCTIGDRVKLSHDVILVGLAWPRIVSVNVDSGNIVAIRIDEEVLIEAGKTYAIEIRTRNGIKTAIVTSLPGFTQDLVLSVPLAESDDIRTGDLSVFGEAGLVSIDAIVMDISPQDDLSARITMVDYAPEIFDLIDDPDLIIPAHDPKISKPGNADINMKITGVYNQSSIIESLQNQITDTVYDQNKPPTNNVTNFTCASAQNPSGLIDVTISWQYSQGDVTADGFLIFCKRDATTPDTIDISRDPSLFVPASSAMEYQTILTLPARLAGASPIHYRFGAVAFGTRRIGTVLHLEGVVEDQDWIDKTFEPKIQIDDIEYLVAPLNVAEVAAKANENDVSIEWFTSMNGSAANTASGYVVQRSKDNGASWHDTAGIADGSTTIQGTKYEWPFDRSVDGYPEKSNCQGWIPLSSYRFRVKAVNQSGLLSAAWTTAMVDVTGYKTWMPTQPAPGARTSMRTAALSWAEEQSAYGRLRFEVQISKDNATWFEPATGLDVYASEDNWRQSSTANLDKDVSAPEWTQALPLAGQAAGLPVDTTYYFRVRTVLDCPWTGSEGAGASSGGKRASAWSDAVPVIARATSAFDLVQKAVKTAALDDSAVTLAKLHVLSKNKVHNFLDGNRTGWNVGIIDSPDISRGPCLLIETASNAQSSSDAFEIDPTKSYKISASFKSDLPKNAAYFGAYFYDKDNLLISGTILDYNPTTGKWTEAGATSNPYFWYGSNSGRPLVFTELLSYLVGCDAPLSSIPAPSTNLSRAFRLPPNAKYIKLRTLNYNSAPTYGDGTLTKWWMFCPSVTEIGGSKIVAENIFTQNLASICGNLSVLNGGLDDEYNYWVLSDFPGRSRPVGSFRVGDAENYLKYESGILTFRVTSFRVSTLQTRLKGTLDISNIGDVDTGLMLPMTFYADGAGNGYIGTSAAGQAICINGQKVGINKAATGYNFSVGGTMYVTSTIRADGSLYFTSPISGGWARGFETFNNAENLRMCGIGAHGAGDSIVRLAMGHGSNWWDSGLGLYVNSPDGSTTIGTLHSKGAKLRVAGKIRSGSQSATSGSTILEDDYNDESLGVIGNARSSGALALQYGVRQKETDIGFAASTSINAGRAAIIIGQYADGIIDFYTRAKETLALGADVAMNHIMRIGNDGVAIGISNTSGYKFRVVATGIDAGIGSDSLTLIKAGAGSKLPYIDWRRSDNIRAAYLGWGDGVSTFQLALENGYSFHIGGNVSIGTTDPAGYMLRVNGALRVDGKVKPENGIAITNYWNNNTSQTKGTWYSKFAALLPNIGDAMRVHGGFRRYGGNYIVASYVERVSATQLGINGFNFTDPGYVYDILPVGDSNTYSYSVGVAW